MKFLFTIYFLVSFGLLTTAQLTNENLDLLRLELANQVNQLRISKGLKPLLFSDTLRKAAQNQSDYMSSINEVTHDQKSSLMATPKKRVLKYKGNNFEVFGENVLMSQEQKFPLNKKEITQLAEHMFLLWKNSPGHYANMIHSEYDYGDFGFTKSKNNNAVYAAQVFGKKGITIEGQSSPNAFSLTVADDECDKTFASFSNVIANMGNNLEIEGNEVVLYLHNLAYFGEIFLGPNDGVAVDLISRSQFSCNQSNQLDVSAIHDGILLKPIYRDELLAGNRAQNIHRLITPIGIIPEGIDPSKYIASVILIKDGQKCKYLVPAYVPAKKYDLRPIEPVLINPQDKVLQLSGIIKSQEVSYDFQRGRANSVRNPNIRIYQLKPHSARITCYTSVEGDSSKNNLLHTARGKTIKTHIQRTLSIGDSQIEITASENWDQMRFQFKYLYADSMLSFSQDSVKKIIALKKDSFPWDSLLFQQRHSTATINYLGELSDTATVFKIAEMNLRTALVVQDYDLANKALYELFQTDLTEPSLFFEGFVFEALKKEPQLVQNSAAIYSKIYQFDLYKTTEFINSWIPRISEIKPHALNNILHLYTLIGKELLTIWDLPSERLSNVIHPNRISNFINDEIPAELALNLHLTFIQYFGQINDGPNISKSFDYIVKYFQEHNLTVEDEVDLCLFFNSWSRYDLTNKFLLKRFKTDQLNEDGLFILAQTLNFYETPSETKIYEEIHKRARASNSVRWCNWLYQDFQILRNLNLKEMYCETCEH